MKANLSDIHFLCLFEVSKLSVYHWYIISLTSFSINGDGGDGRVSKEILYTYREDVYR